MNIEIIGADPSLETGQFAGAVNDVLNGEGQAFSFINIIFLGRDELREMKQQYFDLNVYTDVITFNLNDPEDDIEGEVYLSLEQIKDNAIAFKTDVQEELHRVLIHGCLHLCGYEDDKPERKQRMTELEDKYLAGIVGMDD